MEENVDTQGVEKVEQLDLFKYMNTDRYVYKSNNLIESSYKLSINAHRLIYLAIKKLKPIYINSDLKPSEFRTLNGYSEFRQLIIYTSEFKALYNITGNSAYESLKKAADEIFEAEIDYYNDNTREYTRKSWAYECNYDYDSNYIRIIFNPSLIFDLLMFKNNYSKLLFDATTQFTSVYHIRTYELLKKAFVNKKLVISVEDYRYKLAVPPDKYTDFSKLKNKIIDKAIEAINSKSDILVYDFKKVKQGRSTKEIIFYLKENNNIMEVNESVKLSDELLDKQCIDKVKQIIDVELDDNTLLKIADITLEVVASKNKSGSDLSYSEYLSEKVGVVKEYISTHNIRNYPATLITAIRDDWKFIKTDRSDPGFNNFTPRVYDYDSLEKKLLGWD